MLQMKRHRDAPIMVNVASFYVGDDDKPRRAKWVADLAAKLHQGRDGGYVNFVTEEGLEPSVQLTPDRPIGAYRRSKDASIRTISSPSQAQRRAGMKTS